MWLLPVTALCGGEGPVLGIAELYRLDLLPKLGSAVHVGSVSSYDRTGGNDDGFSGKFSFVSRDDQGLILADLKGPGIIYRIWTPTPTDDVVEFLFDGESEPRITVKFRDLFRGQVPPFVSPLVGCGAGGFYSYVPLCFEKACKVRVRAERLQFYQINFARYPDAAAITTWERAAWERASRQIEKAKGVFSSAGSDLRTVVAPPGAPIAAHTTTASVPPGGAATLFNVDQPGRIVGLRIAPAAALAGKQRDLLLRFTWDGDSRPAVLCPAGDFFGYAWGSPAVTSLLLGTRDDTSYCYFPMPFDRSAKIELLSERRTGEPVEVRAEVLFAPVPRGADEGKFHALWRRENPTEKGRPFTFVETEGQGHLVGCILQAQGMVSGNTYFFEGDDQTTIDGELVIHGTGSEDFFNGGWYDVPGRWERQLSFPLSGCLGYQKHLGRTGGYRLMLGDAYRFQKSIRQTIEHAPTGNDLLTDYCAVSFLYLAGTPTWPDELPAERQVMDFEKFEFVPGWSVPVYAFSLRNAALAKQEEEISGQRYSYLSLRGEGENTEWFGPHFLSLICEMPDSGRYRISIKAMQGPEQAQIQLFENEQAQGALVDLYAPQRQAGPQTELGIISCDAGPQMLMFKLVGRNPQATGWRFDLISVHCERVP